MTRSDLVNKLAERFTQLTQRDTEFAVKTILDAMSDALARGQAEIASLKDQAGDGWADADWPVRVLQRTELLVKLADGQVHVGGEAGRERQCDGERGERDPALGARAVAFNAAQSGQFVRGVAQAQCRPTHPGVLCGNGHDCSAEASTLFEPHRPATHRVCVPGSLHQQ